MRKLNCLVIKPVNQIDLSQYKDAIIKTLHDLAIIEAAIIKDNHEYFFAGDQYLQHISFLGCSPYLNFDAQKELTLNDLSNTIADLNYIQIDSSANTIRFKNTDFGVKAICPKCKTKISEWRNLISNWEKNSKRDTICPECQQELEITDIDWKKTAGFYSTAILFHGIQAELALPTDNFLAQLESVTKTKWHYFYG